MASDFRDREPARETREYSPVPGAIATADLQRKSFRVIYLGEALPPASPLAPERGRSISLTASCRYLVGGTQPFFSRSRQSGAGQAE